MGYWLETALRPLKQYADFRGRSTRSEVVAFYFLMSAMTVGLNLLAGILVPALAFPNDWVVGRVVQLALLCPALALSVRRFHDQGKSGWWLMLILPALCANAWQFYRAGFSFDPIAQLSHPLPGALQAALAICMLTYFALLIWKDDEGANRYGPNPRYDAPVAEPA